MGATATKVLGVAAVLVVGGVLIGFYIAGYLVGDELVDGKPLKVLPPDQPSHTFAVPELGILVPIAPVPDNAKNTCNYAPCALSLDHRTITFTFRTGKRGHYRWQCFVPCAAGYLYGFGGPMQSIGYMDGFLDVV